MKSIAQKKRRGPPPLMQCVCNTNNNLVNTLRAFTTNDALCDK